MCGNVSSLNTHRYAHYTFCLRLLCVISRTALPAAVPALPPACHHLLPYTLRRCTQRYRALRHTRCTTLPTLLRSRPCARAAHFAVPTHRTHHTTLLHYTLHHHRTPTCAVVPPAVGAHPPTIPFCFYHCLFCSLLPPYTGVVGSRAHHLRTRPKRGVGYGRFEHNLCSVVDGRPLKNRGGTRQL